MARSDVRDEVRWSLFARLPLPLPCLYCLVSCEGGETGGMCEFERGLVEVYFANATGQVAAFRGHRCPAGGRSLGGDCVVVLGVV